MLAELAIGDAYGFSFEFVEPAFVLANNDGLSYHAHPHNDIKPGTYSDDTELALAVADFILYDRPATIPKLWDRIYKATRIRRAGYAAGFREQLDNARSPEDLARRILPTSTKSGGAMRAATCGLFPKIETVIDMAMMQASITHATRNGMAGAAGAAALVWACRQGCSRVYLPQFLEDVLPGFRFGQSWVGPVGNDALHVVKAAASALAEAPGDGLTEILKASVAFTGDVDTVASIAMAAGSMHPDIRNDLHIDLYNKLEPEGQGSNFVSILQAKSKTLLEASSFAIGAP